MDEMKMANPSGHLHMTDVGSKPVTRREATASGRIRMSAAALRAIRTGKVGKGNVLVVARMAGIMAAKKTSELIPLCHPIQLDSVEVEIVPGQGAVSASATVRATAKTGVEMEALTAVSAALLTVYDMLKPVDRTMVIESVRLEAKSGGRSGKWLRKGK